MAIAKPKQNVDLLHGSILKSMIIFALPILVSNLFQQLYNTVDTMVVGNFLGETSLAAIGASTPIYDLMVGFTLGFGNGLAIATARAFGSGDRKLLKKSVACALMIDAAVAAVITILAQTGARPLLILLDTPGEILSEAYSYIATITLFTAVTLAYNLCSGILRATGNSFMPLIFLMISSVLNIVLDLLFITQLNMGIRGAAVATVISQGVSVVLCIIYIYRKNKILASFSNPASTALVTTPSRAIPQRGKFSPSATCRSQPWPMPPPPLFPKTGAPTSQNASAMQSAALFCSILPLPAS